VDDAITDALRRIVLLLDVDRSQLIRFSARDAAADITHSWAMEDVPRVPPKAVGALYPWAMGRLRAGVAVVIPRIEELPSEAAVDQASFGRAGVRSNLTVPMAVGGQVGGALAVGCLRRARDWPEALVERVQTLADVFANALDHKRAQEALDAAVEFERTVSRILANLLTSAPAEVDRVIEAGLAAMARVFGAERATLWRRVGGEAQFVKTHRWLAAGAPRPPDTIGANVTPWASGELVRGNVVRFASHRDLPPEAASDLPGLQSLGIRAAVNVPLSASGTVVGALAFAATREEREWPDALVPRARLFGEVLVSVLARQAAERRAQEAQAQAAHAVRVGTMGVFAASLVHELTQPLAASLANAESAAELAAAPAPNLAELRATIDDIVADDRRAGELIQQLRRFLRRGEVERTELDFAALLGEVLRLVGSEAAERGVEVALDEAAALPKLVGDRVQLQQVLVNLLLNAFDAVVTVVRGARRVAVRARASGTGVVVEVADSGPGMDEATLARVFEPFFTTKPRGMGLGLAISRTIVSSHGGTLTVRSAPGAGTTFRVALPSRPPGEARAARPAVAPRRETGAVFVIDDDPSMRRALERQLQGAGYRVETFDSAQAYLDRPAHDGAACIVSDVRMPGLSGLDLQASLAHSGRDLPIVFISGHGDVPTTVHAMKAGAVGFLAKPFTKDELLATVAEAVARGRKRASVRAESAELRSRYASLTAREREVFALVATGLLNKVVADRLGIAEKTVKIHRGRVMEKLAASSVADLVRMAERIEARRAPPPG
jgi:FixJ family two-component response regulator/signal transduction histidine kinase